MEQASRVVEESNVEWFFQIDWYKKMLKSRST